MTIQPPYRIHFINAAMGAQRLSNDRLAKKAGVSTMTVSRIRNGDTQVGYVTLKKVVEALGLTMAEIATPKDDQDLVVPHAPREALEALLLLSGGDG